MNFRRADGCTYADDHVFSQAELLAIVPADVYGYMCVKAFGVANPGADARPIECRSSTLAFAKKAISHFMPNRLPTWNVDTAAGNPTKSVDVNNLIKRVKRHEVRREGVVTQAVRPLETVEFVSLIVQCMKHRDATMRYALPAFFKLQCHMISRVDDVAQLELKNVKANMQFPFSLLCQINWSKNVLEERDASDQIVFGSMNPKFCVLWSLGVHFETSLRRGDRDAADDRLFPISNSVKSAKALVSNTFKRIVESEGFERVGDSNLGTHSLRKLSATLARRLGCSRDDVDHRGRWKPDKRVSDRYIHVELPYPDAKVAAALCVDGACKYVYNENSNLCDNWVAANVTPAIDEKLGRAIAVVLGRSLLWAIMSSDPLLVAHLPTDIVDRVRNAYALLTNDLGEGTNPIVKVPINVTGFEGAVFINEVGQEATAAATHAGAQLQGGAQQGTELLGLFSQVEQLHRSFAALQAEVDRLRVTTEHSFSRLGRQVRRIAMQPIARRRPTTTLATTTGVNDDDSAGQQPTAAIPNQPSVLSRTPRTLDELWVEYQYGLGGRKAARLFTRKERGKCRHTYCRRNVVWSKVAEMVRAGDTAQIAIDKIRVVYGASLSVTTIINRMMADRKHGGHPQLRV